MLVLSKTVKQYSATAEGIGNPVFIVGSATGKDGIGALLLHQADITAESAEEFRPYR